MSIDRHGELRRRLEAGQLVCAGVLSGTSADGIDVVLCRPGPFRSSPIEAGAEARAGAGPLAAVRAPELLAFDTMPFEPALRSRVRAVLDEEPCSLREQALLSRDLGRAFGRAVAELARDHALEVGLVGSHGQTVYHHDGLEPSGPATLQLGDGDFVAAQAGAPTVSDFRQADIAAGGEGAPLSALCDDELFSGLERPLAILNLGGIANLTLLDEPGTQPLAFDTGPAGALLDGLARALLGRDFDEDGRTAGRGRADAALVAEFLEHPFLERAPPKSTGRDTFGAPWVARFLARAEARSLCTADTLATGVELVARCVVHGLEAHAQWQSGRSGWPGQSGWPGRLIVCGGGARNRALVRALERLGSLEAFSSDEFGVPGDAREALCFALLAARFVLDIGSTSERATGALLGRVVGKFCW